MYIRINLAELPMSIAYYWYIFVTKDKSLPLFDDVHECLFE